MGNYHSRSVEGEEEEEGPRSVSPTHLLLKVRRRSCLRGVATLSTPLPLGKSGQASNRWRQGGEKG